VDNAERVIGSVMMIMGLLSLGVSLFAGAFLGFNWEHVFLMLGGFVLALIGYMITQEPEHRPPPPER
jgi:uncharacterized membrane protein